MRLALFGAGSIGSVHARSAARMAGAELVAVYDIRPERAESVAKKAGARAFHNLEEPAGAPEWGAAEAVLICVPTYLHEELAVWAAVRGKHVFCEKPLALTAASALRIETACRESGVRLGVGHVVRFAPEYQAVRERLRQGAAGEIGTIRTFRGGSFPVAWDNWYADDARSGGVIMDLLIHDLDYVDWAHGPIARVFARRLAPAARSGRDYALVVGRTDGGAVFHMEATWAHAGGFRYGFEYAGARGLAQFDSRRSAPVQLALAEEQGRAGVTVPESPAEKSPYQLELEAFAAAVARGEEPPVNGADGIRALQLSLACLRSAAERRPVDTPARAGETPAQGGARS